VGTHGEQYVGVGSHPSPERRGSVDKAGVRKQSHDELLVLTRRHDPFAERDAAALLA
jgi:hypothetical protein